MNLLKHMLGSVIGYTVETRKGHPVVITDSKVEANRVYVKANDQWMRAANLAILSSPDASVQQDVPAQVHRFKFKLGTVLRKKNQMPGEGYLIVRQRMIDADNGYIAYYMFAGDLREMNKDETYYAPRIEEFYEEVV